MAELAASLSGILEGGTKLSIAIFDFASSLGAVGLELHGIATEAALLSAVVRDFQKELLHGGPVQSPVVISNSQEILDCCRVVIGLIEDVLASLNNSHEAGFIPSMEFVNKVKWTFQRPQVKVLASTLESCKLTLKIMLTTMEATQKVWRQKSFTDSTIITENEEDRIFTQSLIIAQQCAIARLRSLEDESERNDDPTERGVMEHTLNGTDIRYNEPASLVNGLECRASTPQKQQKLSIWLSNITSVDEKPSEPHPGTRQQRLSSAGTDQQPMQLMRKWALLKKPYQLNDCISEISQEDQSRRGSFSFAGQRETMPLKANNRYRQELHQHHARGMEELAPSIPQFETSISSDDLFDDRKMSVEHLSPTAVLSSAARNLTANSEAWPSAHSSFQARDPSIVPTALDISGHAQQEQLIDMRPKDIIEKIADKYGMSIDKHRLLVGLVYGGRHRTFAESDSPLGVFRQFQEVGLEPQLLLHVDEGLCGS